MRVVTDHTGEVVTGGIVITKYGHADSTAEYREVRWFEAVHPIPDGKGPQATREVLKLLDHSDELRFPSFLMLFVTYSCVVKT